MAWTFRTFLHKWKPTAKCVVAVLLKLAGGAAAVADPANQLLYQCLTAGTEQAAEFLFESLPAEQQREVEDRFTALQPYLDQHADLIRRLEALADQQADQNRSVDALTLLIRDHLPTELETAVQRCLQGLGGILSDIQRDVREIKDIVKNFKRGVSHETEEERAYLLQQRAKFRQLPRDRQKAADWSNLADRLSEARLFEEAQVEHANAAKAAEQENNAGLAAAEHFKAFRAACEKEQWDAALASLKQAVALNPQLAPFNWKQFKVLEIVGAGGFGTVFRCHDTRLDHEVAIKSIHTAELARGVHEVFKEAAILTNLHHPAIIGVKTAGFADEVQEKGPYIVMEYFPSRSLAARLKQQGPLPVAEFLRVVRPVAEGLRAAHRAQPRSVYHRDVKPDNVLLGQAGQIKVIDFGLAVRIDAALKSTSTDPKRRSQKDQSYVGTLKYAPPELKGESTEEVKPYSDIFSFGRMACELLFGIPDLIDHPKPKRHHYNRTVEPVPAELVALLKRCQQPIPEDRPQDFQEVLDVLDQLETPPPPPRDFDGTDSASRERQRPETGPDAAPVANAPGSPPKKPALLQAPFTAQQAKEAQAAWAKHLGRKVEEAIDLGGGVKLELVLMPPGTFQMGSPKGEKDRSDDEAQHPVTITRPFYLGKYPVTQQQYEQIMGSHQNHFQVGGDGAASVKGLDTKQFPVESVSHSDAESFCQTAAGKVAWGQLGLPSEAQWEYACRAGTLTPYWFGGVCDGNQCNCDGDNPYGTTTKGKYLERTCKVGGDALAYKPNAFGLYDMHGNVWEWCLDYYGPYEGLDKEDPVRLDGGSDRVFRGGSWCLNARNGRSANRYWDEPSVRLVILGFRLAVPVLVTQ